jgi:hypothetical protein
MAGAGSLVRRAALSALLLAAFAPVVARAAEGPEIRISRTTGPIEIDGDLSDAAWKGVTPITDWLETNPGDNVPPQVRSVGYLAYDESFLYAAFEFDEPDPSSIRAPYGDRDNVPSYTDYGGIIVDSQNDGHTAQLLLANARGIQYDALSNDASGEDSAPDYFWDSAAKITATGWVLEMRVPFSSMRYTDPNPERWGILLYRNRPRDFRYQMFTSRLPRDSSCFICHCRPLVGLEGLPSGQHYVVAPYVSGSQSWEPEGDLGSPLESGDGEFDGGVDVKWVPSPSVVVDATVNPDFSQIEADAPQISANERFALFFEEKRPFFLEGVNLFRTPIQAVYTRTFTSPSWGGRVTGGTANTKYTLLVGEDDGGGSVILPGPEGSDFADQDFESLVAIGRVRHDFAKAFVSFLMTGRSIDGGGSNWLVGPDFEWRPTPQHTLTGQVLYSWSETPDRPDLAEEWNGQELGGHAFRIWYQYATETWDFFTNYEDIDDEFRADNGFVPQVGYRSVLFEGGRTFRWTDKPISRLRLFTYTDRSEDLAGNLLQQEVVPGFGLDATYNSFIRFEFAFDEVANAGRTFDRFQFRPRFEVRPGKVLQQIILYGAIGDDVDFANNRAGEGWRANFSANLQPTDHLNVSLSAARRVLDVEEEVSGRLFTADVARLRGIYNFNARTWLRLIGEWQETERDPSLYTDEVPARDAGFAASALFAYKLNWQTVLYFGVGEEHLLLENDVTEKKDLEPSGREVFLKVSYAFQR